MKERALVTGASSGIGMEIARELAAKGFDLVLCARSADKLNQLKDELEQVYNISVDVIVKDLSVAEHAVELYNETKENGLVITALINNAGAGNYGPFLDEPVDSDLNMMTLNMQSLVTLTKLFAKDMVAAGHGRILNIASLLSYFPYPYLTVYAATKAFVLHFTEGIRAELKGTEVTISALCPGPTDSSFGNAELYTSNAYKMLPLAKPKDVARKGVKQFLKGKGNIVTEFPIHIITLTTKLSPRKINLAVTKFLGSSK